VRSPGAVGGAAVGWGTGVAVGRGADVAVGSDGGGVETGAGVGVTQLLSTNASAAIVSRTLLYIAYLHYIHADRTGICHD